MAIKPIGFSKRRGGFTLIEIMVVLLILSITTTFAMLSITRRNPAEAVTTASKTLYALLQLAHERAILQPVTIGVSLSQTGYRFLYFSLRTTDNFSSGKWQVFKEGNLSFERKFDSDLVLTLVAEEKSIPLPVQLGDPIPMPVLIFSSSGEVTPFRLRIASKQGEAVNYLEGRDSGQLSLLSH